MSHTDNRSDNVVEKLSDRNYRTWKTEIKWLLKGKGLLGYALGDIILSDTATTADRKLHQTNDDKALATIGLSLEIDQQIHVEDCKSAHEAWQTLEQIHEPKSRVRIMQLKKAFYHLQMKGDEHMSAYIARAKVAATNLRDADAEVKDEDLAYAILTGLPDDYENLNMALASLPDDKFTSAEIKRVLLAEYDRRQSRLDVRTDSSKEALVMNKRNEDKKTKTTGNEKYKLLTCFNCRKVGHLARDCRLRKDFIRNLALNRKRNTMHFSCPCIMSTSKIHGFWIVEARITCVSNESGSPILKR